MRLGTLTTFWQSLARMIKECGVYCKRATRNPSANNVPRCTLDARKALPFIKPWIVKCTAMPSDKGRLYVALYARGGKPTMPDKEDT